MDLVICLDLGCEVGRHEGLDIIAKLNDKATLIGFFWWLILWLIRSNINIVFRFLLANHLDLFHLNFLPDLLLSF